MSGIQAANFCLELNQVARDLWLSGLGWAFMEDSGHLFRKRNEYKETPKERDIDSFSVEHYSVVNSARFVYRH